MLVHLEEDIRGRTFSRLIVEGLSISKLVKDMGLVKTVQILALFYVQRDYTTLTPFTY